ncbi:MAG: hypothetical protein ACD_50C00307G0009 [uncultured bacterium]|nr:MAG: hypothetical protein ACD_50C00307G0009 [uncultured bacterium]OGH14317.1 MAG: hypothetical protein A2687_01675 [Candidatus Levybacteria bacterium RIFCSPHIGHO2_01_FULL_38_26]
MTPFLFKDKKYIILLALLVLHIFLRFYEIETKSSFLYDQVDSAWAAKRIIVDHNFPLIGPENKLSSGFFVGPLYYYAISIFYFFTNLDPIAAGLFAGFTSIIGFFTLFFVVKKLFTMPIALIAVFINTVSYSAIEFDRVQWEVNFIPLISLLAFYFLYKILLGSEKHILYLAIVVALAFHIHLTVAVFLPLIILFTLPFFPKTKKTFLHILLSIPILAVSLSPIIIVNLLNTNKYALNQISYIGSSFHGLHLTRVLQLFTSAFIQIEAFTINPIMRILGWFVLPVFFVIHFLNIPTKKGFVMVSLVFLYFLIPWLVLSTYSGEVTNYYFSTNRFLGVMIASFIIYKLLEVKNKFITLFIIVFAIYYAYIGINKFLAIRTVGLQNYRAFVLDKIKKGEVIEFEQGSPFSYFYYLYTREK